MWRTTGPLPVNAPRNTFFDSAAYSNYDNFMLHVKTPEETLEIIISNFGHLEMDGESVPLRLSLGRVLYEDIIADEAVPDFNRSTVDGYALMSSDTFGCSDSLPALLRRAGEVKMGSVPETDVRRGECVYVQTGGEIPAGADAVVMIEYTEDYGDGMVGILRPCSPGENIIFIGDDVTPGRKLYHKGHLIKPHDIGALSALGESVVKVCKRPIAGIISTGNELIPFDERPAGGQIRDVNSNMLEAAAIAAGCEPLLMGIIPDEESALIAALKEADECDLILISGGSSAGNKDVTLRVIEKLGRSLIHGIAMKPGKPTIVGEIEAKSSGKPVFGLPGHPVAAYFIFEVFVYPLICRWFGTSPERRTLEASLDSQIPSNHGRAEFIAVKLEQGEEGLVAIPVIGKSGLITQMSGSDGYIAIPRDCEGLKQGSKVTVNLYS